MPEPITFIPPPERALPLADRALVQIQAPLSLPRAEGTTDGTNLLLAPSRSQDRLRHFAEGVFDTSPETHLVRFLKVLLGDSGVGQLRKKFLVARLQTVLQGSHFFDLDRFYGALFGVRRRTVEQLPINPYLDTAVSEDWRTVQSRDADYRARIYSFARAINFGGTAIGLELAAEGLLNVDVDVYETYAMIDQGLGGTGVVGTSRREFVVRPKRAISSEETYDLIRVLGRLKPAHTSMEIAPEGVPLLTDVSLRGVSSDSEYWEVRTEVAAAPGGGMPYQVVSPTPVEQPRPAWSAYQGEAWSYNADVDTVSAYVLDDDGVWDEFNTAEDHVLTSGGVIHGYPGEDALATAASLQAGRAVSDGVLSAIPYEPSRART